ncbi:polynucleotide kinase-phosphatase [Evansella caseinilytica]|uniref:Polynucleotide kinase-phosphatase n=1 Tax=Evansella caseinilytica TaxID=1503961 RepID=A0A1H3U2G9_9BACI|nr:polynucleotide kinase-phosphatase [Evansella caseinilytica]SDZ56251.1 polynucleotide kinase-phosphatase [Evansella caseinilytica]
MRITLPHAGIVLLIGPSNSGKSHLVKHLISENILSASEAVSSDTYRVLVSDTEFINWRGKPQEEADSIYDTYQAISREAFAILDATVEARCRLNKLTFVDATHLRPDDRKRYLDIARINHVPIIAVVLDIPLETLLQRDDQRDSPRGKRRIKQQYQLFTKEKRLLKKEHFLATYFVKNTAELAFERRSNPIERDIQHGIDIIGDIHGCYDEMIQLLENLGYVKNDEQLYLHPAGRKFVSIGDCMSRGSRSLDTMLFFTRHINNGLAYMIDSNHGWKIARWLDGKNVVLNHGDEKVAEEFSEYERKHGAGAAAALKQDIKTVLLKAPSHYVFTRNGTAVLVCVHAGIKDKYIGKQSKRISDFCRYGDTDGFDEQGKPIRKDWFLHHQTKACIVWGHDPKPQPLLINNTVNIDQGVVFGGKLTAFRYPEKEFVAVDAAMDYSGDADSNPLKELESKRLDPPNIAKFINGYTVLTEAAGDIHIPQDAVKSAVDTMSHYTIPVENLIYLPPTMSPAPSPSSLEGYLEHPAEAIAYYRSHGVQRLIAEKKHMGSRAILFLFKDRAAGKKHVGFETEGVIYTRTGRRFFPASMEAAVLRKINQALHAGRYFEKYKTEFVLLDAEIMPWNLKASELIRHQYAHVSETAILDRQLLEQKLAEAVKSNGKVAEWRKEYRHKLDNAAAFQAIFQKYCWDVDDPDQIEIAPFHVLAHSEETFFDRSHLWHMERNRELAGYSPLFVETAFKVIDDAASEAAVIQWWEEITAEGHEGIVIKPEAFIAKEKNKLLQPAIKVRGRNYLRIIYGMDYLEPENLRRLKKRNTGKKQRLALKEFALGIEGIRRFVNRESIDRVHECVLGTLALESDPADPRL